MHNQSFKRLFISILCLWGLITTSIAQDQYAEKHVEVALRMIGHQLLLKTNDSTSRVLPVKKKGEQYQIEFETELQFNPDTLIKIVNSVLIDQQIADGYIVEVADCESKEVVYSFEIDNLDSNTLIPCRTREVPKSCYRLLLTLSPPGTKIIRPIKAKKEDWPSKILLFLLLASIAAILLILRFRKKKGRNNAHLIQLGKYRFDQRNAELILEEERTELTGKESDLLLLLHQSLNSTVEREVILNKVWGDEGDYIGRTLDVFISKLRKKLEADPTVKIVNVRGVGYKLVFG